MQVDASTGVDRSGTPFTLLCTYVLAGLGFGCMVGWGLVGVFSPSLSLLSYEGITQSLVLRSIGIAAIAITYALCKAQADWVLEHHGALVAVTTVLSLTVVLNAALHQLWDAPMAFGILSWALYGVGDGVLCIAWCAYLSLIPTRRTGVAVTGGSVAGTVLFVLAAASSPVGLSLFAMALLPLVSMAVLVFLFRQIAAPAINEAKGYRKSPSLSASASFSLATHGVVYGFISLRMCLIGTEATVIVGASGIVSCACAVAVAYRAPKTNLDNSIVQRITLPVIVVGLVFMPLFDDVGVIVCGCLVNNALAFSSTMTRSTLSIENAEFHLHPVARYAERQVPHWVGFLAGTLLAFAVSSAGLDDERVFLFVVAVLVALAVVAFAIYGANDSKAKAQLDDLLTVDDPAPDPPQEEHVGSALPRAVRTRVRPLRPVAARGGDLHAAGQGAQREVHPGRAVHQLVHREDAHLPHLPQDGHQFPAAAHRHGGRRGHSVAPGRPLRGKVCGRTTTGERRAAAATLCRAAAATACVRMRRRTAGPTATPRGGFPLFP